MARLRRARMDELCDLVTDGTHDSPRLQRHGVPFIKGKHISSGSIDFSTCDFITPEDHEEACRRVKPQRGDILFSNIGSVGDTAVVSEDREFSIKNVALFRPDRRKVEEGYLYYLVLSPEFRSNVMNVRSGSAQPFISLANLRSFEANYHEDTRVQRRIAGVLSAYDELIENNQRRIQILETMARALYREWFVEFRFPGHDKIPRVASPLGDIPQGWETKPLGEVAHIFRGRSYRSVDLAGEGGLPFLNLKCIDRDGGFRRSGLKRYTGEYRDTHIAKKGDIVVAVTDMTQERRIVARAALVPTLKREFGVYSMDLVRVEPRPPMPGEFLYVFLRYSSFGDEVKQHANGVNVLHLAPKRITEFQLVVPPIDLIRQFTGVSAPTLGQMDTLESQIENLRRTRDLLLPRLLSGQVALTDTAA